MMVVLIIQLNCIDVWKTNPSRDDEEEEAMRRKERPKEKRDWHHKVFTPYRLLVLQSTKDQRIERQEEIYIRWDEVEGKSLAEIFPRKVSNDCLLNWP